MPATNPNIRSISSLDHAWLDVVTEWDNPRTHDELLRLVTAHDAWAWAARRYKDYMQQHPGDALAQKHLRRIECGIWMKYSAAAQHEKKRPMPYRATISVLTMLCIALGFGSLYTACLPSAINPQGKTIDGVVTVEAEVAPDDDEALAFEDVGERSIEGFAAK